MVLDSGVNQRAFAPPSTRSDSFREYLLSGGRSSVAVYTGGLQRERGIQSILEAAERMPATQFGLAGGTRADIDSWVNLANARHINNITFFGYLPQDEAIALQRAADVLLMTRAPGHRASISSPLKFFEYLASGVPVVAAETPVLERFKQSELGVVWYKPDEYGDFLNALSSALDRNAEIRAKSQHNISLATNYSWEVRQKSIFKAFELDQFF
ncbi:glycosyltransferase [Hyphomonas sp.]|uniref:glycosyltransferase n=1 Tax=Hyphomonas sp. TaxID=87 RepID=UPI0025BF984D|nr:glycosyltransferase [Hyphomonas sp.]